LPMLLVSNTLRNFSGDRPTATKETPNVRAA
jgi:hypothetical protein